jgi:hypothetical protein
MTAVFSLKDVVRMTGLQGYQIQHAYITGVVEEPRVRISGRRVYEMADIRKLCKHFGVELKTGQAHQAVTADAE